MRITIQPAGGAVSATNPKLLADTVGVDSRNVKPGHADMRPWSVPLAVYAVPVGTKTIYRMGRDVVSDTQYWLTWNTIVHAIHGFVSGDTTERTYYTGDGPPKQTNNVIGLAGAPYPSAWRYLGVPAPDQALVVTPLDTGVATDTEIRYYTYTYVTDWGDESAPGPVSAQVTCKTDDTLSLANVAAPPSGSYGINRIRFYRTQSGTEGDAEFYFLREEISTTTATTDDGRALGEVMPTDGWASPPDTLACLTAMWNGMAAAINTLDGSVRYCIAYKPYAWPIEFETLTPNAKAVALVVFGQRMLILTNGRPMLVAGSSPDSLDEQPLEIAQSCVAPQSAVGLGHGAAWASPDGLVYFGESGAKVVTAGILTREQWQDMNPTTIIATAYEGAYFGSYLDGAGVRRGFFIDCVSPSGVFYLDKGYTAMFRDESQDALYVLDAGQIKKWDAGTDLMTASFVSKVFTGVERNFAAARVECDGYPVNVTYDVLELEPEVIAEALARMPGLVTSPNSSTLRYQVAVTNNRPFRLPSGYTSRAHQFRVESLQPVQWMLVATSIDELTEDA